MVITDNVVTTYDLNGDYELEINNEISSDHLMNMGLYCDFDGNNVLNACEIHECVMLSENLWREEFCGGYGMVYCECPFYVNECEGAWDCHDIDNVTLNMMSWYDLNGDYVVDPADFLEPEHY